MRGKIQSIWVSHAPPARIAIAPAQSAANNIEEESSSSPSSLNRDLEMINKRLSFLSNDDVYV